MRSELHHTPPHFHRADFPTGGWEGEGTGAVRCQGRDNVRAKQVHVNRTSATRKRSSDQFKMLMSIVVLCLSLHSIGKSSAHPVGLISNIEGDANIIIKQSPLSVRTLRDSSFPEPWLDSEAQSVPDRRLRRQLNFIQSKLVDVLHPQPIVDTMKEEERYGNTVEHTFGKKVVRAIENLSKVVNTAFEFPVNTVKKATKSATEALNAIGGKLVGLQK